MMAEVTWKGGVVVMTALFVFAAAVQYNDPDGVLWIGVYGVAAVLSVLFIMDRLNWIVPAVLCGMTLLWAGALIPDVWGRVSWGALVGRFSMKTEAIEKAREMGGLLIVAVWAALQAVVLRRRAGAGNGRGETRRKEA